MITKQETTATNVTTHKHSTALTLADSPTECATNARLLIIDDLPENIGVLYGLLSAQGYEVLIAEDGITGIETVHNEQPDLILLDVMMPQIDGFEVCRRLKQSPDTQHIPIIFLTALSDTQNKLDGFRLGAVDYITKPLQHDEVLARVNTHLSLQQLRRQQQQFITRLQDSNAELDAFAHTVAHDLKNPLGVVSGMAEVLCRNYQQDADLLDGLQDIRQASDKMRQIIDALLLLAKVSKQQVKTEVLDMNHIMQNVLQRVQPQLRERGGQLVLPQHWPMALGQAQWIEEVWANYLSNALKYGGNPPRLDIGARLEDDAQVCFWVKDNGAGLSNEAQQKVFTPFTRLQQHVGEEGHGLGLSIVERIIKKLGGQVGVDSQEGQGARFFFRLPKAENAAPQAVLPTLADATRNSDSVIQFSKTKNAIHLPSPEHLDTLLKAVRVGDVGLLEEQLEDFAEKSEFSDFYQEIQELAHNMKIKQLRAALEHYRNLER